MNKPNRPLGVHDAEFKFSKALDIVRRYIDRRAVFNKARTAILFHHFKGEKELQPLFDHEGNVQHTRSGRVITGLQFVRTPDSMSREAAIRMVDELSEG